MTSGLENARRTRRRRQAASVLGAPRPQAASRAVALTVCRSSEPFGAAVARDLALDGHAKSPNDVALASVVAASGATLERHPWREASKRR